jgi:PAS domain S-box-containing protein
VEDDLKSRIPSDLAGSVLETMRQPLVILDERLVVRLVNDAFCRAFEVTEADAVGRSIEELGELQWDSPILQAALGTVLEDQPALTDVEIRFDAGRRGPRTFVMDVRRVVVQDTRSRLVLVALDDVTDRRRAELERDIYERRLERSNRDLEEFAHAASHDLQEPLRKVRAFADRLERSFEGAELDERQRDYLTRMRDAAERMQIRIDDLLTLARVGRTEPKHDQLDLTTLVASVVQDLDRMIADAQSDVVVGPLPTIEGDASQLALLFQNLIANAIKYRKPGTTAQVRIGTVAADSDHVEIEVADNGIGFDPAYAERIFKPFERLHGRDEYEGSGIGLSICRRVAELHGGTITAHGEPDRGAVFTIRLPVSQREEV